MTSLEYNGKPIPVLPDWTRWAWASQPERDWWTIKINAATTAWEQIERMSVVMGVRSGAVQTIASDKLQECVVWAMQHGLVCIPIQQIGVTGSYAATTPVYEPGKPFGYRVLYVTPDAYQTLRWPISNGALGEVLGYPTCCREHFQATWGRGQIDSTYEQLEDTMNEKAELGDHQPYTLIRTTLRWMGIRLVPHMPCNYYCKSSEWFARQMIAVGEACGYHEEMQTIQTMLRWPVELSRLFGISEIKTPAFKISTRTDWTPTLEQFTLPGTYIKPVTEWWTENGFSSAEAMHHAHSKLIGVVESQITDSSRVMDMGCGNGLLLYGLKTRNPNVPVMGIDIAEKPIKRGKAMFGSVYLSQESIQAGSWTALGPNLVIINPVRLLEMTPEDARLTCERLRSVERVIVYLYSDWASQRTLEDICHGVGLPAPTVITKLPSIQVGVI